jgi:hypothetical protein
VAILKYRSPTPALKSRSDRVHCEIHDSDRGLGSPLIRPYLPTRTGADAGQRIGRIGTAVLAVDPVETGSSLQMSLRS